jgi:hypothetical protein
MGRPREQSRPRRFTDDAFPRTCVLSSGSHGLGKDASDAGQGRSAAHLPGRSVPRHVALKGTWARDAVSRPPQADPQSVTARLCTAPEAMPPRQRGG